MKKLLICTSLLLVLVFAIAACNNNGSEDTTTDGTTSAVTESTTEAPTTIDEESTSEETTNEETTVDQTTTTEAPTTEPETEPEYYEMTDEKLGEVKNANDKTIVNGIDKDIEGKKFEFAVGDDRVNFGIRGWIGFNQSIKAFGYRIDDNDPVFNVDFTMPFENDDDQAAIIAAGGENAKRFKILVPTFDLANGEHKVSFIVKLKDDKKVIIDTYTVTLSDYVTTDDSESGYKNWSGDTFYFNGKMYFDVDGKFADKLKEQGNIVPVAPGEAHNSCATRGWIGFDQAIDSFGYRINYGEPVFGDFKIDTEDAVLDPGNAGPYGSRFQIEIPLADLTPGDYKIFSIVKLEDGTIVIIHEFTLSIKSYEISSDNWHTSMDHVNGKGPDGSANYSGKGANSGAKESIVENAVPTGDDSILTIDGWCFTNGGIKKYVYSLDGGLTWNDCLTTGYGEVTRDDLVKHGGNLGYTDFAQNGFLDKVAADLSEYAGQTVSVTFAGVRNADNTLCTIATVKDVEIKGAADPAPEGGENA